MLSSLSGLQISHFMFVEHFIDGVSRKHVCQKNFRRDPESTVISHIIHIIWPISFRPYKMIVRDKNGCLWTPDFDENPNKSSI